MNNPVVKEKLHKRTPLIKMPIYFVRYIRREFVLAKSKEKVFLAAIVTNLVLLLLLYANDQKLCHHAAFAFKRTLGYNQEVEAYSAAVEAKGSASFDWGDAYVNLKKYLSSIEETNFTDENKKEAMKIGLSEALVSFAKMEHKNNREFPHLLKTESARNAIKMLKKFDADMEKLQTDMEESYDLCKGCLQEKYGRKQKRLPQVICIGAKKCGTGAFQNFLSHHPHLHKPPGLDEVHFFDNDAEYLKGIEYYQNLMPETSPHEVTYEKTPKYMVIPEVPDRIRSMNNTIKIIAIVCNPVNRAFSDYTHVVKSNYFHNIMNVYQTDNADDEEARLAGFEHFSEDYIKTFNEKREELGEEGWENWIQNIHELMTEGSILSNGLYWIHMKNWLNSGFQRDQMLILNGEELIADPAKIIMKAQQFMGLEPLINNDNFIFDEDKGFFCFKKPKSDDPSCLGEGKGRTRKQGGPSFRPDVRDKLYNFFQPFNEELFNWIGESYDWQ